jgi:hypothetical protein
MSLDTYNRDKLLKHLEETAKGERDWDEAVPYAPGVKRGYYNAIAINGKGQSEKTGTVA